MKLYQVDAITDRIFGGNPAAICPLESWLSDEKMQQIAMENNLSETAFFVKSIDGFEIRWFTPEIEIDLCGHATLASAHVIFNHLDYKNEMISFQYGGGFLTVKKDKDMLSMNFPAVISEKTDITDQIILTLGKQPLEAFKSRDLMVLFESEKDIHDLNPDLNKMAKINHLGVIVTAPGKNADFVSRFFAPNAGINEDPVTGSAHCMLIPFWADRLGKNTLKAQQLSKRGGNISCEYKEDRVEIAGKSVTFMVGEINI